MKRLTYHGPNPEHNVLGIYFERGGPAVEVDDESAEILLKKVWDDPAGNKDVPQYIDQDAFDATMKLVVPGNASASDDKQDDKQTDSSATTKVTGKNTVRRGDAGVAIS